jgi:Glycosyltransferases involved in cell wall biogenesis
MGNFFIVVPCYNEELVINETTQRLTKLIKRLEETGKISQGKILYVDDGSKDTTWDIIESLSESNKYIAGLKLAHNVGHQQALWAGMETVVEYADAIVSIDADLQDDVDVIENMVDDYNKGIDVVFGVRKERKTDSFFKKHTALLFYKIMSFMGTESVYNHADFRLLSKKALKAVLSYPERNLFIRGIVTLVGFKTSKVYYDRHERFAGESKYPFSKMLNFAIDGITSFSVKPLRWITSFGFLFILISIGVIIYAIYEYFAGNTIPGWTSLLVSLWFIAGVLLVAIGVVGEYIGKIYKEVKRRPLYFEERRINI